MDNKNNRFQIVLRAIIFYYLAGTSIAVANVGIFENILTASGSFTETTTAFETALAQSDLQLHEKYDMHTPENIQKSRLYILTSPAYLKVAENEPANTISAQILRVAIYEYDQGKKTFINMINPLAHAMIYYENSKNYGQLKTAAESVAAQIRLIASKVPGTLESKQLAPIRKEVVLNKYNGDGPAKMMTMFRNWEESQDAIFQDVGNNFENIVNKVEKIINASKDGGIDKCEGWRILAKIKIREDAVYFGITNTYTENRTIKINSDFRKRGKSDDAPYPGVDHTAAFPMEILVYKDKNNVKVIQYGQMWRMQLYFWDSGYTAFAKYTLIPGIISGSIKELFDDWE